MVEGHLTDARGWNGSIGGQTRPRRLALGSLERGEDPVELGHHSVAMSDVEGLAIAGRERHGCRVCMADVGPSRQREMPIAEERPRRTSGEARFERQATEDSRRDGGVSLTAIVNEGGEELALPAMQVIEPIRAAQGDLRRRSAPGSRWTVRWVPHEAELARNRGQEDGQRRDRDGHRDRQASVHRLAERPCKLLVRPSAGGEEEADRHPIEPS